MMIGITDARRRAALFCEHENGVERVTNSNVYPCFAADDSSSVDDYNCEVHKYMEWERFDEWKKFDGAGTYLIECSAADDEYAGLCEEA